MRFSHLLLSTALAAATLAGVAQASTYVVQATTPVGSWLDTGLTLNAGQSYDFTVVDPATIWSAGSNIPYSRDSTANGIDPVASGYGQETQDGFTANFGALVGEAGSTFFLIGTGPITLTGLSGDLKVGYWDSYYGDNSGIQTLAVSAIPEPATWAVLMIGLGFLGLAMRQRRTLAVA